MKADSKQINSHRFDRLKILTVGFCGVLLLSVSLSSCFTGIESTRKITERDLSRDLLSLTSEEQLAHQISGRPLGQWPVGKAFIVADSKLSLLLQSDDANSPSLLAGDTLLFVGTRLTMKPDGDRYCTLSLLRGNDTYLLDTRKKYDSAITEVMSDRLPLMIDVSMVNMADSLLTGRQVWSRSNLIYDREGNRLDTLKYIPLTIDSVRSGNSLFPMKVWIRGADKAPRFFYMDFGVSNSESRPLQRIFSLSNPRLSYPHITDAVWDLIRQRKVAEGMTREECKLSLGNPSDVQSGRDYNYTYDIWSYPDGIYLRFVDGRLADFRK